MINLHIHTSGSTLDGACDIPKLVARAKELGMPALGISDHGNMIKALEFQEECFNQGIKPIIGCEFYIGEPGTKDTFHIMCIAKNNVGLKNLYKLNTYSYIENFYGKPRISYDKLMDHREGLIVTTACIGSEFGQLFLKQDVSGLDNKLEPYVAAFGDDFYLEIQPNAIPEQAQYNKTLIEFSRIHGIQLVATCDVHYIREEDYEAHDALLCMQVKKKVQDKKRFSFYCNDFYLKEGTQIISELVDMGISEDKASNAVLNTHKIADKCNAKIETNGHYLPRFEDMLEGDMVYELGLHCNEGYKKRYKIFDKAKVDRINYELSVIEDKGYAGYFLIVEDYINYAKKNNIMVGAGRGSAAGSVVAYLLGITNIDPFKYGLLFERFLNPDRSSDPDKHICPLTQ